MRLWRTYIIALVSFGQFSCASYLTYLGTDEGQYRLFRDKSGLYEVRIPDSHFRDWQWDLPVRAFATDLILFRRRAAHGDVVIRSAVRQDNEVEIIIGHPLKPREDLAPSLAAGDITLIARELMRTLYEGKSKKFKFVRVGDQPITPEKKPEEIFEMPNLLVDKTIGVHQIIETAPHIFEKRTARKSFDRDSQLRGLVVAFQKVNDKVMILMLLADLELLEENRQAFHEVIRNIRFLERNIESSMAKGMKRGHS